jgi:AAA domain
MTASLSSRTAILARFPVGLNLPNGPQGLVEDAAEAVRREYRSSVRCKRLRCRKAARLTDHPDDTIFVLDVGHSIEFDWTWEGAVAFRPPDSDNFGSDVNATSDFVGLSDGDSTAAQHGVWAGEVVEVDEAQGRLFVSVSSSDHPPCCGTFFVRPFEFLAFLHTLFCQAEGTELKRLLPARLNATRGDVHPSVTVGPGSGLKKFEQMWSHSWAVLWGPPGCGKTTTIGKQAAACLGSDERILVVSTTNNATDAAALAIGKAAAATIPQSLEAGLVLRIGKGADHDTFDAAGLTALLRGTETDLLRQVGSLSRDLEKAERHEDRAILRRRKQELSRSIKDQAFNIFVSPNVQIVVATAFKAITLLNDPAIRSMAAAGEAPFTTVIVDEAGLMGRAVVAGISLLAARRVVVVGDAKQLAPISKISRVLPTSQAVWLASSCLTHLQRVGQVQAGVHMLQEQHRMHPQVSRVVSHYQYEGALIDAPGLSKREPCLPPLLAGQPRAVWYVLDEDGQDLPAIRAERGPGNISWCRPAAREVLRKFFFDPEVRKTTGLFITPFKAQARDIAAYFAAEQLEGWSSGTVHGRQGVEANVVIFDTVNAGSCGWSHDDWKRLINVGLSRAREFVLLLASRSEMDEPYLRPLLDNLAPRCLKRSGKAMSWVEVPARLVVKVDPQIAANPDLLGSQIERRKSLRPVMSADQQRLCGYIMDGKPRLVRGVAGSGKTVVLAHWLQKTVRNFADKPDAKVWAVYANRSLHRLIADTIEDAWKADGSSGQFPWGRVELLHIRDLLRNLLPEAGLSVGGDDFNYDAMADEYLKYMLRKPSEQIRARCQAMFVDEAQDMGPNTLMLLTSLVEQTDPSNPKSRAMNIFYDDAQNIYGRARPKWSEIGLEMRGRGRSTVMKESFRSTRPITEFALNVLYHLQPPDADPDHKELMERGLVERTLRGGNPWWNVRYNQVEGPVPIFRKFPSLGAQIDALGQQVVRWIREEGVKPSDICILYNGRNIKYHLEQHVAPLLQQMGSRLVVVGQQGWRGSDNAVLASTTHSYKGYDSEVVVIAGVEQFIAAPEEIAPEETDKDIPAKKKVILAKTLYVAMTRARSVLAVYSYRRTNPDQNTQMLLATLEKCLDGLLERPKVELEISNLDDFEDILGRLGADKRDWLATLWKSQLIQQEPIMAENGEILAEPLFWFRENNRKVACFGNERPGAHTLHKLEDNGVEVLKPGLEPPAP